MKLATVEIHSSTPIRTCLNCDHELVGEYCSDCGQKASTCRFEIKSIKHEIIDKYSPWDSKIVFSVFHSLFFSGDTIKRYLAGERTKFVSPFLLLLTVTAFAYGVTHYFDYHWLEGGIFGTDILPQSSTEEDMAFSKVDKSLEGIFESVNDYIEVICMLLVSVSSYLIFKKCNLHLGEHFVLNAHAAILPTVCWIVFIPILSFFKIKLGTNAHDYISNLIVTPLVFVFYFYTYFDFFKDKYSSKIKLSFLIVILLVLVLFFTVTLVIILALLALVFYYVS